MASTANVEAPVKVARAPGRDSEVLIIRAAIIATVVVVWELASASGLFYRDVVPSLLAIGRALMGGVANPVFLGLLGWPVVGGAGALAIGGAFGVLVGLALGGSRFLALAFEHYLYY